MKTIENRKAVNIISVVAIILIFAISMAYLLPVINGISSKEGQITFRDKIENSGAFGIIMLFALEVAQILLVIIPGEPLEVLAGMCYGSIGGTVFITASVFITTTIIVMLVRKYGRKFVYDTFGEDKIKKIENNKLLKNPKKVEFIMIILFLIPGTPKDLLTYIGGLLPINKWRFILISTFARFPSVISSTIVGANLLNGNIKISATAYAISFIFTAIVLLIINYFDKDKETRKTIEALK